MNTLYCVIMFFGFFNVIAGNTDHVTTVPKCEIVEFVTPLLPESRLKIEFNLFGAVLNTTLNVVEDNDLISPQKTGIWNAYSSTTAYQKVLYGPWPQDFNAIGNFRLLQNVKEGSALARFWDAHGNENIVGILRYSYTVKSVPEGSQNSSMNHNQNYDPDERPVNSTNGQDKKPLFLQICKNAEVTHEYFRRLSSVRNYGVPNANLSRSRRQNTITPTVPGVVRPKLLVIFDYGTMKHYTNYQNFITQFIGQLNAVDMMFRQLKNPQVHLNIAGIIIPRDYAAVNYISKHIDAQTRMINGIAATRDAEKNFWTENHRFPHKEWDSILMMTTNTIGIPSTSGDTGALVSVNGFSPTGSGCTGAAAIVRFIDDMEGIYTITHELGHMLGANLERDDVSTEVCDVFHDYLTIANYSNFQKVEWTYCSRFAFQSYFRSYAGRCAYHKLREVPGGLKSLHGPWLPLAGQCKNKFYNSTGYCMNNSGRTPDCSTYGCKINGTCTWLPYPPMDGSLFDDTIQKWACVNRVPVLQSTFIEQ